MSHISVGMPTILPALITLLAVLCASRIFRWLHLRYQLWRLPRLGADKLTREGLITAAYHCSDATTLVRLPGKHGLLVTDPALARKLLESSAGGVCRDVAMYERYGGFLRGALVLMPQSSQRHRHLRSALLPLFSSSATRRAHPVMLECTQRFLGQLGAKAALVGSARPVPLYRLLQEFVIDVTARAFLAHRMHDADARRLIALLEEWLDSPPPLPPAHMQATHEAPSFHMRLWRRIASHVVAAVNRAKKARAADRPQADASDDSDDDKDDSGSERLLRLYDALLERACARMKEASSSSATAATQSQTEAEAAAAAVAVEAESANGTPLVSSLLSVLSGESHDEVKAQVAGLLFAGLNSAKELREMLDRVAHDGGLQAAARAEADAAMPMGDAAAPSYDAVSTRLALCTRIVHEALRLSPGIEHLRLVTTKTTPVPIASSGGVVGSGRSEHVVLPAGTRLVVSPALIHRHPRFWPPPADRFQPDDSFDATAHAARPAGCFLPFSAGAKGCPAAAFALHEMRMLLALTLQRFDLAPVAGGIAATPRAAQRDDLEN